MADNIFVYDAFEEAQKAELQGDLANAARLYRICDIMFENGELYPYDRNLIDIDIKACDNYRRIMNLLPKEEQTAIRKEYSEWFAPKGGARPSVSELFLHSGWRAFCDNQYKIISSSKKA